MKKNFTPLGIDAGNGAFKLYGAPGGLEVVSQVLPMVLDGGAILLKDSLPHRFNGRAFMPNEPVQAIARGLYRLTLLQQARKGK